MATDEIRLPADGVFLGGRWPRAGRIRPSSPCATEPSSTSRRRPRRPRATSASRPIRRAYVAKAEGRPVGTLADIAANSFSAARDPKTALPPFAGRPSGGEGGGRHLRRFAARARHRGAGARLGRKGRSDPRRHRLADRPRPLQAEAGLGRGRRRQGQAHRARRLVAISRSRHRPGRRNLHQVPAHGVGRFRRRCRPASDLDLEQSRAGNRGDRVELPAASSAPRSATTSICATSRAAPHCCSARPRTTTRPPRSAPSSAFSTKASRSTT